jgi:hypothetical protein
MAVLRDATKFTCRVCGEPLRFDPWDESTYVSKTAHEDFFGMQLMTYRIVHESKNERHFNSVVVDQDGFFRGHRDAYVEPLQTDTILDRDYWLFYEEHPSQPSNTINVALLISRRQRWIVDVVCPESLNAPELATLIMDRVEEAGRIYSRTPEHMEAKLADLDFHVWVSESRVFVVSFKDAFLLQAIERIAHQLMLKMMKLSLFEES